MFTFSVSLESLAQAERKKQNTRRPAIEIWLVFLLLDFVKSTLESDEPFFC